MNYPNYPEKHVKEALISPEQSMEYLRRIGRYPSAPPPKAVIFCYQRGLWDDIRSEHGKVWRDDSLYEVRMLNGDDYGVGAVGGFGVGAPVACIVLEHLIAFGVKRFVSIGTAGSLQKDLAIGDLVVCQRAIRDEGTSHHYLATSKYAVASQELTSELTESLEKRNVPYQLGVSWTIDAPYRETITEAHEYQQEGVVTVEMEASALFSVAQYRGVEIGAMFTISDSLADLEWRPDFDSTAVRTGLNALFETAWDSLS